jgi:predicted nucleic acid-binding protein
MHAVLADTGPLFAAADEDDADHERALRQIDELYRDDRIVLIPYPILLEAYSLVLKRFCSQATLRWLGNAVEASRSCPKVHFRTRPASLLNPTPEDYSVACAIVRALSDQDISLVDATVAALATRLKVEVWTYDHHFDVMRVPVWR